MAEPSRSLIIRGGVATFLALCALAISQVPLGSPWFFILSGVPGVVYALLWHQLGTSVPQDVSISRLLKIALLLAVAFRVPLAAPRVGADNDMVRYMYDGRLQRLGFNPFEVVPADPSVAWTHTDETRKMPSIRARTPYPAAAQLFFRLVVTMRETSRAMKWALVLCDLLTIWVLVKWLQQTNRSPWLSLLYAWNPLVILEVAHSGHIDALGALFIAASAWMLSTGRTMRAAVTFVLAVASKLLPIVLVPLYWKRIRFVDGVVAAVVLAALYFPFRSAGLLPLGAVPNVVAFIRFNGPAFKWLATTFTPQTAAAIAVLAGVAVAAWMRFRRDAGDPAAWAWPMAVSLAAAPVIYPWYLLYFTPFLFTRATLPLVVWTYSVIPVYIVWHLSKFGHRWFVPGPVVWVEFTVVLMVLVGLTVLKGAKGAGAKGARGANGANGASQHPQHPQHHQHQHP